MTVIEIDVISDFVCAWCYIGKRKLDMAISLYQKTYPGGKSDVFSINYRPYYLNYGPSTHSVDKREIADARLGSMTPEQRTKLFQRMNQIGRAVGINFQGGGKIGDTRHAHRLVHLSRTKSPEIQNALVDGIFAAYHELEKDISSKDVLREIAVGSGLEGAAVDEWFHSDLEAANVDEEAQRNRDSLAGSGVPAYIIQGSHHINGAEDAHDFMEIFIKVKEGDS
ncbi:thioredoxin-like protein [Ilyonectria robusta]|uniref:thioredoxin-like protein n=1 Tax=Ilyonectria robusta TaxID=1079257 RepID=UPI001E8CE76D|nr:thioredoxin-like protein [Ilyonectria robusta]KAH8736372.1 thioredoxin-like protein [Ilyonectria robusta]